MTALVKHERIHTTHARAKACSKYAEKLVNIAKDPTPIHKTMIAGFIREMPASRKLWTDLADRYKHRPGGYTRVVRTRHRFGDAAPMAIVEFIDREGELKAARPALPIGQFLDRYFPATLEVLRAEKLKIAAEKPSANDAAAAAAAAAAPASGPAAGAAAAARR